MISLVSVNRTHSNASFLRRFKIPQFPNMVEKLLAHGSINVNHKIKGNIKRLNAQRIPNNKGKIKRVIKRVVLDIVY